MAPSQPPADEGPAAPPAPYFYDHVTDERVEVWTDEGRAAVLEEAKNGDSVKLSTVLQELIRSALDKRLDAAEAGSMVKQIVSDRPDTDYMDTPTFFLNTLSLLDDADTKNPSLLSLVAATDIDPELIRQELDIPILQSLSLVRSTFTQMRARKTTNVLYRQANFNLLREETEGYAKLLTEFFNTANTAVSNPDISPEAAFERITALVGSFDLDVGRVLDVTLDISANLLVRAYDFFVKFYRCSFWWPDDGILDTCQWVDQGFSSFPRWALPEAERPKLDPAGEEERRRTEKAELDALKTARDVDFWQRVADENIGMDAFFELGARRITNYDDVLPILNQEVKPDIDTRGKEPNIDRRKRINENRKYMKETGLLPPPGNADAAQLLGFKLRFYASDARDKEDVLPDNLIYLAALLIKIGFISLRDLYPHLYPDDGMMKDEEERLRKEKADKEAKERPGGGSNALSEAKPLTDDTIAPGVRNLREKERSGGSTPKVDKKDEEPKEELPTPVNQKILLLKALLCIGAIPESMYILGRFPWLVDIDTTLPPYLHRIANKMLSKVAENIRPLSGRDKMDVARPELRETAVGPDGAVSYKGRESKKPTKWLGIDKIDQDTGSQYRHYYPDWDDNIPVCQDIEDVITLCNTFLGFLGVKIGQDAKLLGTLVRIAKYSLKSDFSEHNQSRWLELMRRLIVPALSLSKHNPGLSDEMYELLVFFPTITRYKIYATWFKGSVSQYSAIKVAFAHNKAEVKDVLRRVTNDTAKQHARALAKVSFSSPGIAIMDTIDMLETYSNMIPALVECTRYFPALAVDVLGWCLIQSLSGLEKSRIQEDGMLTSAWLQALAQFIASLFYRYPHINPSPILQCLASELRRGNITDLEVFDQVLSEMGGIRSDLELNDTQVLAMAGGEHLQTPMLNLLADKRYSRKKEAQRLIKALEAPGLVGQLLIVIAQERQKYPYRDEFEETPLKVLGNNLDKVQAVFTQYLEFLRTNLTPEEFDAKVPDLFSLIARFHVEPRVAFTICRASILHRMQENEVSKKQEPKAKRQETNGDVDMADGEAQALTNGHESGDGTTPQPSSPWDPVLEPIINQLPAVLPELSSTVSVPFYTTFWTLSLAEVANTLPLYQKEFDKVKQQLDKINVDRSDMSTSGVQNREKKKKALLESNDNLRKEMSGRAAAVTKAKNRISSEKVHYFAQAHGKDELANMHLHLLQECFLPRALLSSTDALYSFMMLKLLHDFGTPGFNTMSLFDQIFKEGQLTSIIFQCTATEAQHFGRFLCEILKLLGTWYSSEATFKKEAYGGSNQLPGFKKGVSGEVVSYDDFQRLLFQWHNKLSNALQTCLESEEYMLRRNGITVLKSIVTVFPAVTFHGEKLRDIAEKHAEDTPKNKERPDLRLAAMSLLGFLKSREKQWVMPQAFRKGARGANERAASATPQPGAATPQLSAAAPEFKPGQANGTSKESIACKEDGEIDDERQAAGKSGDEVMKDAPAANAEGSKDQDAKSTSQINEKAVTDATEEAEKATSKPSTPANVPSKPPPSDSRSTPTQTSRGGHGLPNRPESRPSRGLYPHQPSDRQSGRYPARGEDKYGRLDRPDHRPPSRDHSPSGRNRARSRSPGRDPYYSSFADARGGPLRDDRGPRPPPSDARYSSRDDPFMPSRRDQPPPPGPHSRPPYDSRDRTNGAMGPPGPSMHPDRSGYGSSAPHTNSRPPSSSSQQLPASQAQDPHHVNPARLAMINDDSAAGRDRGRELMSQPKDPRRDRDDRTPQDPRANAGRGAPTESPREPQGRNAAPADIAPSGPRRGRLSRDLSTQAESSYGRLNGPTQEAPSGPRAPNGPGVRGGRNFGPAPAPAASRPNESPLPSPSTQRPPESPAAFRGQNQRPAPDRHGSGQPFDRQDPSISVPTTPGNENGPAVHPSRVNQVGLQPPPLQTNVSANGPRSAASPTSAPPSGPRGPGRAPTGPASSSSNAPPPAGPASAAERQQRNRQRADINATLQGASGPAPNGQGVNFRGAAQNRQPNASTPSAVSAQPVQSIASSMEPPRRNEPSTGRQEPPVNRPASRGGELFQQKPDQGDEGGGRGSSRRREDDRGDRARGSRNASRERRPEEPQLGMEDRRDRRGAGRDDRRKRDGYEAMDRPYRQDDGAPRRPPPAQEAPASYNGPPPDWDHNNDRRGPRRDGPNDSRGGVRSGGRPEEFRGGPRREGDRRDGGRMAPREQEPPQAAGRKRGHDDGAGPAFDESKRRRSGR